MSAQTETQETEANTDGPLLDLTDAGVKKFIKQAKARGYVTMEELNKVLPSEEVTPDAIEDTLAMLSEMGVNVVEAEEDAADVEGKDLMVQVRGTPFGGSEHDFAQAVTAMVTPPAWYRPPARIVSVSAYENNPSFRMVFLFGAPYTASGVQACAETPTLALAPSPTPLTVQGAVCKDNVMIAEAEGLLTQVDGPNDPALRRLISSMTNEMLTYQGFGLNSSSTDTFFRRSM